MSPVVSNEGSSKSEEQFAVAAPQLSLPKGGGAIHGMGEKFAANPVTGTGTTTIPIFASPGRSGFAPKLSLSYDSGSGNSPFGLGWTLGLPSITRKTDKGLPQYEDAEESDTYILSGAEDLMPQLVLSGSQWIRDVTPSRTVYGKQYSIHRYRPRVEGLFARIERWANLADPQDTYWRSISKDNVTTWYGTTPESRIADPANPARIFTWLICQSYDDKGNVASYAYRAEDSSGVDLTQANERNRSDVTRSSMRHITTISYGNLTSYFPALNNESPTPLPMDWCFQLVFDYGDRDLQNPNSQSTSQPWTCRFDPYSSYRSTFEVRTYRLCRRILMFHQFANEANVGTDCLVRSTDLSHATASSDPTKPGYSYLLSATQSSYLRNGSGGYLSASLPPVEFEYTDAEVDETVREIDTESLQNEPYGLDGSKYRWVDLDGEGLSGILTEQAGSWFYKANLSPANQRTVNGELLTLPQFAPTKNVAWQPSLAALGQGKQQLMDLSGDGQLDIVQFEGPSPGFFERTEKGGWKVFQSFEALPVVDWQNPNLKFIDLTGDGFPDLLISEDDAFWWHTSFSIAGFGPAQRVPQHIDEERGPQLLFEDGTESVFIADMSGDGLSDLVRVRNGEVCYWPNLGYGRFGAKVTMDNAPVFERPDLYDGRRIRLADIDGSGTADIIYFASDRVQLFFNQSGNSWGDRKSLNHFPSVESVSSATALDLLGNGTACLLWSSPLAGNVNRPMRYIDLMGGQKPHLLVRSRNNLGAETAIQYAPSTKFYVADKLAGTPWVTRLAFPVHVVEHVETYDYIGRNRFATQYAYHHGYYDGVEREFRGFGRIDQWDTEEYASLAGTSNFPQGVNEQASSNVPPMLTRTWFHTGAYFGEGRISKHLEHEYYNEGDANETLGGLTSQQLAAMQLPDTVLPTSVLLPDGSHTPYNLSGEEMREACRALRGSMLRQEVYALDGGEAADRPYSIAESNYTIEVFQPRGPNKYGVFLAHARGAINFHYERKLFKVVGNTLADQNSPPPGALTVCDPRVTHAVTLAIDYFGNVLQSVEIGYGRRYLDPALTAADQAEQSSLMCSYTQTSFTNAVMADDNYRAPLLAESSSYELLQVSPAANIGGVTNLFGFDELQANIQAASDGLHDIPYEQVNPTGLNVGQVYRRLLGHARIQYRPNDMGVSAANPKTLLPLRQLEFLALPGSSYRLAFTPGLLEQVYQRGGNNLLLTPANVLGSVAPDGGGYVDLDGDGNWWIQSGRVYYANPVSIPAEAEQAFSSGFLPRLFEDPFGNAAVVDYDLYGLLVAQTTDAVGNVVAASNDYRVLAPSLVTDANGNRTAVSFDVLGMVAGTAVMGKTTENLGDSLSGFAPDLTQSQIDDFYAAADPHTLAGALLANATARVVYDVNRFWNSKTATPNDPTQWEPPFAATIARETHVSDLASGQSSKTQISFSHSDGFGREIQRKAQTEPDPATKSVIPRWVASGWTIFNNKGKPVRQYEPFFSQLALGQQFEFGIQIGVSPILCYDPVTRVVATLHPDQTYEKVVFDPWHQQTFDGNDNVLENNPVLDPDVGDFFQRLPDSDYTPSWYALRTDPAYAAQAALQWPDPTVRSAETAAATKTAAHADTPSTAYLDSLGRPFLTVVDNAGAGKYSTRVALDIQGLQRSATDALNREVMTYDYDVLGNRIHQSSMEAGQRWTLTDVAKKPIRAWDTRGHNLRTEYDAARRPVALHVQGTDANNSDPRTLAAEVLFQKTAYGEGQPNGQALNLRTRVFQTSDSAAVVTNVGHNSVTNQDEGYDFKGNLLRSTRQFVADYKPLPNWTTPPALATDLFTASTKYDALNRPVTSVAPDESVVTPTYNESTFLETLSLNLQGATTATPFVTNIDYDAKGRRTLIEYGNQTTTTYSYDQETFRLNRLTTARTGFPGGQQTVQDLSYVYDPVGNITHIQDDADTQNVIFFSNQRVEPSNDYTYDAIYRLIQASGREQLGLGGNGQPLAPTASSYNDVPRVLLSPSRTDGKAMGTYTETYQYDPVGNFLKLAHAGSQPQNAGWTRSYAYNQPSLLEPAKVNNRLSSSAISGSQPLNEPYAYDVHGNMTQMPQLQVMQWDFKDELIVTQRQSVNSSDADGVAHQGERTYYVYDGGGQRARKVTESSAGIKIRERFYLGGYEVYREYDSGGAVTLERQTLHIMDDKQRVALVETRTQGNDGSPAQLQRYQFSNHLGSASLELDDQANVISYEEYCPYGNTSYQAGRSTVEVSLKRYRYTGMERDEESGLNYHTARYYATWLGRWVSCDPIGISGGIDLYLFSKNCPCNWTDRSGHGPTDSSPGASDSPQAMGDLMHAGSLASLVLRARALGLDATFQTETAVGGSRSGKDRGLVDLAIRVDGVHHIYDLKKAGSSISQAKRWVSKYAEYYRGGLSRDEQGPAEPAIPGTVLEDYPQILAPVFYADPRNPLGVYAIEFSLPSAGGNVIPGIIEYKYQFIPWEDVTLQWQKSFVESRGYVWDPNAFRILSPSEDLGGRTALSPEGELMFPTLAESAKNTREMAQRERAHEREVANSRWDAREGQRIRTEQFCQNVIFNMNLVTGAFAVSQLSGLNEGGAMVEEEESTMSFVAPRLAPVLAPGL